MNSSKKKLSLKNILSVSFAVFSLVKLIKSHRSKKSKFAIGAGLVNFITKTFKK